MFKFKNKNNEQLANEQVVVNSDGTLASDAVNKPLISKRRRVSLPQWATAWLVLIPAMIFLVLFMFYPIINTFFMAFIQDFRWVGGSGSFALGNFISALSQPCQQLDKATGQCLVYNTIPSFGFGNFAEVLTDSVFPKTVYNTMILVVIEVPLTILIALLIATFLNSIKVLRGLFQTIFFLPYVTNTIALGLIFSMLFSSGSGGLMNVFLKNVFGIDPINWLDDSKTATQAAATRFSQGFVIVTYAVWNGLAFKILIFMSGLATIDKQYYDAARIDGSSSWTIWRRITLPLLSPQILYITVTSFIGAFKMYTGVLSVYSNVAAGRSYYFGGEKGEEWMPIVGWIYKQLKTGKGYINPGIAAAGSIVLLCIILLITLVQFAVSKKRVHYQKGE